MTHFRSYYGLDGDDLVESGSATPEQIKFVIGQWADYYAEHDGMIESG